MERFIERFRYKATKARQVQSRVKRVQKMERIERDPEDTRSLGFSFGAAERTGRVVLQLDEGRLEVPGRTLLEDGELWLERGEHVSLVGPNGIGKTTLIDALAGRRALDGGRLRTGHNVQLGYLSQHAAELGDRGTALEAAQRATKLTPNKARALLGGFLFSGEEAEKPLDGLSGRRAPPPVAGHPGGLRRQRADPGRAHQPPRPRRARGARGRARRLRGRGAARVPRPRAARRGGNAHDRLRGGPAEELRGRLGRVRPRSARSGARRRPPRQRGGEARAPAAGPQRRPAPAKPSRRRTSRSRLANLEREIERAEAALAAVEDELADPAMWSSPTRSERSTSPSHRRPQGGGEGLRALGGGAGR